MRTMMEELLLFYIKLGGWMQTHSNSLTVKFLKGTEFGSWVVFNGQCITESQRDLDYISCENIP